MNALVCASVVPPTLNLYPTIPTKFNSPRCSALAKEERKQIRRRSSSSSTSVCRTWQFRLYRSRQPSPQSLRHTSTTINQPTSLRANPPYIYSLSLLFTFSHKLHVHSAPSASSVHLPIFVFGWRGKTTPNRNSCQTSYDGVGLEKEQLHVDDSTAVRTCPLRKIVICRCLRCSLLASTCTANWFREWNEIIQSATLC